ncbi:MAG: BPSS1780 family membrane protein [Gammaproteobacteria bacterium]
MSTSNPYAAPEADLSNEPDVKFELTGPKSKGIGRGWGWIAEAFGYFKKSPGQWILTLILGFGVFIVMSLIPVVGQLLSMATYYVWIAGLMLGCHEQDRGGRFKVTHLFAGFNNPIKLIILSLILSILSIIVMYFAVGPIYLELLQGGEPSPELNAALLDPTEFWLPFLFGMLIMIPLMMATWFAPALIAIHDVSVIEAMKLSFVGCLKNMLPLTLYGLIALVLYILGAIPLALGLFVVIPTLLASMYTSYKDIFVK